VIVLSLALLAAAAVFLVVGILRGDSGTVLLVASIVSTLAAAVLLYFGVRPRASAATTGTAPGGRAGPDSKNGAGGKTGADSRSGEGGKTGGGKSDAGGKTGAGGKTPAAAAVRERSAGDRVLASVPAAAGGAPAHAAGSPGGAPAHATGSPGGAPAHAAGSPAGAAAGKGAVGAAATAPGVPPEASEEEDPPDEPGIEAAQLADLARVAGRDDEVRVVDGRPRYHVAGCAHLSGRESEGLPVSEAAELGFTPCARCAPVATLLG
jgi:hypothetical protein